MDNISFNQIKTFIVIAKYLNLSKAAEAMFVSQPAVSRTIKKFEDSIGVSLFTRSNKGMELTNSGRYLYSSLEILYNNMDRIINTVRQVSADNKKSLSIIVPTSYNISEGFDTVKEIINKFESKYPSIIISESHVDNIQLREAIEYGSADFIVTQDFKLEDIQGISSRRISKYELYIAMSVNHPYASLNELDVSMLSGETFYVVRTHVNEHEDVDGAMNKYKRIGISPKSIELLQNPHTLYHAIKRGRGVAICGRFKEIGFDNDIKYFPYKYASEDTYIVIAWRTGKLRKEAELLLNMMTEAL